MQAWVKFTGSVTFITTAVLLGPLPARADRLFTGDDWGTNLYEMDTDAGGWSTVVFCGQIHGVNGLGTDGKGSLFESDFGTRSIRKFTSDGRYETFATLDMPGAAMAFDGEGNMFLPFQGNWVGRIDKLSPDGSTRTVFATDIPQPVQLLFNRQGELLATDQKSGCIYKFDPYDGTRTTFATGLKSPIGLVFDSHGNLFVADPSRSAIYRYSTNGVRTTFARRLRSPCSLAFDSHGNLFMSDGSGGIFRFKNEGGTLSSRPERFATGLGHNYFMTILPGSMPARVLLAQASANVLSKPWMRWVLSGCVLLMVACAGFLLRRKMRRTALWLQDRAGFKTGTFASMPAGRILGVLWAAYCGCVGYSMLFRLLDEMFLHSFHGNVSMFLLRVVLCPMYLAGAVVSLFLFRGEAWARMGVGIIAWVSFAMTFVFVFAEHQMSIWAAVGSVFCLGSAVWLQFSKTTNGHPGGI